MATVEEKAKIKEMLIPYICGVIVIFGTFGIWKMVVDIGTNLEGDVVVISSKADELWAAAKARYTIAQIDQLRKDNKIADLNAYSDELANVKKAYRSEAKAVPGELEDRITYVKIVQDMSAEVVEYANQKDCTLGGVYSKLRSDIYAHYNPKASGSKKVKNGKDFLAKVKIIKGILDSKIPQTLRSKEYHSCSLESESSLEELLYCAFLNDSTLIDKLGILELYEYEALAQEIYFIISHYHVSNPYWNIRIEDVGNEDFMKMLKSNANNYGLSDLEEFTNIVGGEDYACQRLWEINSNYVHHKNCLNGHNVAPEAAPGDGGETPGGGGETPGGGGETPGDEILDTNDVEAIFAKYVGIQTVVDDYGFENNEVVISLEEFVRMNNEEGGKALQELGKIQDYYSEGTTEYNYIERRRNYFFAENYAKENGDVYHPDGFTYNVKELMDFKKENGLLTFDDVYNAIWDNTKNKEDFELLKLMYQLQIFAQCAIDHKDGRSVEGLNSSYCFDSSFGPDIFEIMVDTYIDVDTMRQLDNNHDVFYYGNYEEDYVNDADFEKKKILFKYIEAIYRFNNYKDRNCKFYER